MWEKFKMEEVSSKISFSKKTRELLEQIVERDGWHTGIYPGVLHSLVWETLN